MNWLSISENVVAGCIIGFISWVTTAVLKWMQQSRRVAPQKSKIVRRNKSVRPKSKSFSTRRIEPIVRPDEYVPTAAKVVNAIVETSRRIVRIGWWITGGVFAVEIVDNLIGIDISKRIDDFFKDIFGTFFLSLVAYTFFSWLFTIIWWSIRGFGRKDILKRDR